MEEVEGLLVAWYSLASWNYCVSRLPDYSHCYLLVLSYDRVRDLGLVHDRAPVLACQHWHRVHYLHFHCLHVNDEVDEDECGQGKA